ncbi:DNase1 [Fusarium phyllophilum]|uniref:DNase1 n=1 Tax=Fusarium phyllophilum TaxID=47803 RepID=A0A8H5J093_9HYPO|nr:DNase1 [Fusarium phyllophilum]
MKFATTLIGLVASATYAAAASVTFVTLDDKERTIIFTPDPGYEGPESVTVSSAKEVTVDFPDKYIGNFYAVQKGKADTPGMLGEVTFGGWNGKTYFDVSAIVDPNDKDNVKQMWPKSAATPMSGCETFPCDNCYWLPDDVQTKVTDEVDLITTLGDGASPYKAQSN